MCSSCSSSTESAAPPLPARGAEAEDRSGRSRPPIRPMAAAPSTISGNGTPRAKMATKASAASTTMALFLSARLPTRRTASTTTASTAAFSPKNSVSIAGVPWNRA